MRAQRTDAVGAATRRAMKRLTGKVLRASNVRLCVLWTGYSEAYAKRAGRTRGRKNLKAAQALQAVAYVYGACARQLAASMLPPMGKSLRQLKSMRKSKSSF